jgi:hypothetical protein
VIQSNAALCQSAVTEFMADVSVGGTVTTADNDPCD